MTVEGSANLSRGSSGKRRLKQALDYVARHWFPLNNSVFDKIQHKLSTNNYNESHEALLKDLKADFALFTYCLKKLKDLGLAQENPVNGLRVTSFDELKKILMAPGHEISKHNVSSAEKGQALRLKYTVLSATTAHMLAESKKADSDLAYTCAVIRQLGLNLIAWNYPSIYARAMQMVRAGTAAFEVALTDSLGFSPNELADEVILGDGVHPLIRKASGIIVPVDDTRGLESFNCHFDPEIVNICEISEAFAQLNDPEHYPHISRNYDTVIASLDQALGQNGAGIVMGRVNEKYGPYVSYIPDVFRTENPIENTIAKVSVDYTNKLFESNTNAQKVSEHLKNQIREVYRHVTRNQISSIGIGLLVNTVIPSAGFTKGCVYLLDTKRMVLVPKLRIGTSGLERYKQVGATTSGTDSSLLMEALYANTPVRQETAFLFGDMVTPIIGSLGTKEPIGVLYIEMSEHMKNRDSVEVLNIFRAIRHCLNDCLNI